MANFFDAKDMQVDIDVVQMLTDFEIKNPLVGSATTDMHLIDRLKICMIHTIKSLDGIEKLFKMFEALEKWSNLESFHSNSNGLEMTTESRYPKALLIEHCSQSKEAMVMLLAATYYQFSLIEFKRGLLDIGITSLANAFRLSEKVIQLLPDQIEKFKQLCDAELLVNPSNGDACIVLANINFFRGKPEDSITLLSNSRIKQIPIDSDIYIDITRIRGIAKVFSKQYEEAIKDYTMTLRLGDCTQYVIYNIYFARAHCKARLNDITGAVEDYNAYIAACQGNESNLCDAFYSVAFYSQGLKVRRELYEKGLETEKNRCPVFQYSEISPIRKSIEKVLHIRTGVQCNFVDCTNLGEKKCANCNLVHYCSRECQLADWKSHKLCCKCIK